LSSAKSTINLPTLRCRSDVTCACDAGRAAYSASIVSSDGAQSGVDRAREIGRDIPAAALPALDAARQQIERHRDWGGVSGVFAQSFSSYVLIAGVFSVRPT